MWKKKRPFPELSAEDEMSMNMPETADEENPAPAKEDAEQKIYEKGGNTSPMSEKDKFLKEIGKLMDFYGVNNPTKALNMFVADVQHLQNNPPAYTPMHGVNNPDYQKNSIRKLLDFEKAVIQKKDANFNVYETYYSDPMFRKDLDESGSMILAYMNLLERNAAKPAQPPQKNSAHRSYIEVGAEPGATSGTVRTSPADLPDEEFEKYLKNIMNP